MSFGSEESVIRTLNISVRAVMRQAVTVSPSEAVSSILSSMVVKDIGAVIVVEKDKPVGMITEKDVLERVLMAKKDMYSTQAKDFMSKPVISIEADRSIKEAFELMQKHHIRRLAATENGTLIGVVTERRLLREFMNQLA